MPGCATSGTGHDAGTTHLQSGGNMKRLFHLTAMLALGLATHFAHAQAQEIKIGVIYTVEGAWGSYGQKSFRGIRMSAHDINAKGGGNGAKIPLIENDNRATPNKRPNTRRLPPTRDNVLARICPNADHGSGDGD